MPAEQLSGTIVLIIIMAGVQAFVMLFILAKRQITRFGLRNKRGPHTSIGHGGPRTLRREIDRFLEYIPYIRHEPRVATSMSTTSAQLKSQIPEHFFRAHAIAKYNEFERKIMSYSNNYFRLPGTNVRGFLLKCQNGPLLGVGSAEIHELCDEYEHARHHFEEFGDNELRVFTEKLAKISVTLDANLANKPSPSPKPTKRNTNSNAKSGSNAKDRLMGRKNKNRSNADMSNPVVTINRGRACQAAQDSEVHVSPGGKDGDQSPALV